MLDTLNKRASQKCELCGKANPDKISIVEPERDGGADDAILICTTCDHEMKSDSPQVNHWRCLNDSMWSEVPAVQATVWRILNKIKSEGWPQDLLDMLYLSPEVEKWAKENEPLDGGLIHKDANGVQLDAGDTVVLIKDLNVKGANFTAKRGTAVRGISLDHDNANHIEGRVNGQHIVILTQYVKKS